MLLLVTAVGLKWTSQIRNEYTWAGLLFGFTKFIDFFEAQNQPLSCQLPAGELGCSDLQPVSRDLVAEGLHGNGG